MADNDGLQIRCAENIAFMTFLGDVPTIPERARWAIADQHHHDVGSGRIMTREIEKDLVGTLAFLSSIEDDSDKITAVCVQERSHGMTVVVAANDRTARDTPYLQRVKDGFDEIFDVLRMVSSTHRSEVEQHVFSSIVKMCRDRILARTRLDVEGVKMSIQTFITEVSENIDYLKSMPNKKEYKKAAAELSQAMNRYDDEGGGCQARPGEAIRDPGLEEIIDGFYRLYGVQNLGDILATHPVAKSRSAKSLLNTVGKMAQYRSSATRLVTLARGCPVARRASTTIVTLEPAAFERTIYKSSDDPFHLTKTLDTISASNNTKFNLRELSNRIDKDIHSANANFEASVQNIVDRSKIHAEVQLVSYLDSHQTSIPPRFIASSKDACYLCNLFIASRGKYVLTRTHGKIYPGWRLPATTAVDIQQDFNIKLEQMIGQRAGKIMQGQPEQFESPWESTLFSAAASIKSALSLLRSGHGEARALDGHDMMPPGDVRLFKEARDDDQDMRDVENFEEPKEPIGPREPSEVSRMSKASKISKISKASKVRETAPDLRAPSQVSRMSETKELMPPEEVRIVVQPDGAGDLEEFREWRRINEASQISAPSEDDEPSRVNGVDQIQEPSLPSEPSEVSQERELREFREWRRETEASEASKISRPREAGEVGKGSRVNGFKEPPREVEQPREPEQSKEVKGASEISKANRPRAGSELSKVKGASKVSKEHKETKESTQPEEVKQASEISKVNRVRELRETRDPRQPGEVKEVGERSKAGGDIKVSKASEVKEPRARRESSDISKVRGNRDIVQVMEAREDKEPKTTVREVNSASELTKVSRVVSRVGEVKSVKSPRHPVQVEDVQDDRDFRDIKGVVETKHEADVRRPQSIIKTSKNQSLQDILNKTKNSMASNIKLKRMPQASRRAPPPTNDRDRTPWQHVSRGETKCGFRSKMLRVYVEYSSASEPGPLYFKIRRDTEFREGGRTKGLVYDVGPDAARLQDIPWTKESRFVRIKLGNEFFLIELDSIKSDIKAIE